MKDGENPAPSRFWREAGMPFIEARIVQDGRRICYAKHSHETFSIGAICGGQSTYVNGAVCERVGPGTLVLMNPGDAHACNPLEGTPWAYRMLYVDTRWLAGLQQEQGLMGSDDIRAFSTIMINEPAAYAAFNGFFSLLVDPQTALLDKQVAAIDFFSRIHDRFLSPVRAQGCNHRLQRAAEYITDNFSRPLDLQQICQAANLSSSYLIRAFKHNYGMTPHAYLINRRIQYARAQLRHGKRIVEVASEAGFADQAHLQRTFKQLLAATPGHYCLASGRSGRP